MSKPFKSFTNCQEQTRTLTRTIRESDIRNNLKLGMPGDQVTQVANRSSWTSEEGCQFAFLQFDGKLLNEHLGNVMPELAGTCCNRVYPSNVVWQKRPVVYQEIVS